MKKPRFLRGFSTVGEPDVTAESYTTPITGKAGRGLCAIKPPTKSSPAPPSAGFFIAETIPHMKGVGKAFQLSGDWAPIQEI